MISDTCSVEEMFRSQDAASSRVSVEVQVDPHDRRHLCLCGGNGALTVLKLLNPARDK